MSKIRTFLAAASTVALLAVSGAVLPAQAEMTTMVGGAAMYPSKNIIQNAVNSKDHTTLVAAVKAAGLVETLEGPGPFTVFAPTNAAFAKLPAGTPGSAPSCSPLQKHAVGENWTVTNDQGETFAVSLTAGR